MASPRQKTFHEIAWNGIRFKVPEDWLPAQMGTHYLMLEHAAAPILEIKWGQIKGNFSHQRHLRQLSFYHNKSLRKTIRSWTPPADWQQALQAFQVSGFQWQSPLHSAVGATLYCPVCRTAALIQFYGSNPAFNHAIARELLASYRDHSDGDEILWSAFDIRAKIPAFLKLQRHRFSAGFFELTFTSKSHTVILNRWGPASILLAGKDLAGFAKSAASFPSTAPPPVLGDDPKTVDWTLRRPVGLWPRLINRISLRPVLQQLRMWPVEEKNRILAVRVEGRGLMPPAVFDGICKGFRCV